MNTEDPVSPCVRLCQMDEASGHCLGCGRTLDEIGRWVFMTNDERIAVKRRLPARLAALAAGGQAGVPPASPSRAS